MKFGFKKSSTAPKRVRLSIVEGKGMGHAYHLAEGDAVLIEDGVHVQGVQGLFVLNTEGTNETLVSGIPVREKILEFGDLIKLSNQTLVFEQDGWSLHTRLLQVEIQTWLLLLVLAVVAIAGIHSVDIYEALRKHEAQLEEKSDQRAAAAEKNPLMREAARAGPQTQAPTTEDERLRVARDKYAIADRLSKDSDVDYLNMYWAIQEWKEIGVMFEKENPKPDVANLAQKRLETAQKEFDAHMLQLRYNALIANQSGRQGDFAAILRYMIRVNPDPEDANYRWAQQALGKYGK